MNYPTCYRCPLRHVDGVRCELLQARANALKGLGITSAKWRCEKRLKLFQPGDVVEFEIYTTELGWDGDHQPDSQCVGIIMWAGPRKVKVYVDPGQDEPTDRPVINLNHDHITKTGEHHPVCIHCGKPKGKEITWIIPAANGAPEERKVWDCRDWAGEENARCEFEAAND